MKQPDPTPAAQTNAAIFARRTAAIPRGLAQSTPIIAARADDAEIWDVEGRRYIDFAAGIAVLNTGHRHPAVMAAALKQAALFTHTAFQVMGYEAYVTLAERLNTLAPFHGPAKTVLLTTGAEAVENAVKIARAATGRSAVIAFSGGFHGRTILTCALTGKVLPYKRAFGPMPGEIYHIPFPVAHQGVTVENALRALDLLFKADVEPERVAAIIIEPVQGEGGFYPAPHALLHALRERCDQHGILLIADEIQSGFARTGRMFAIEASGVEPDLVTIAKSLAGGFPLSGVIGRAALMDAVEPGGLGGTYGGNPIACAAAIAVLDTIEKEGLCARAEAIGATMESWLHRQHQRDDIVPIGAIRRQGAMVAFEIFEDRDPAHGRPDADAARTLVRHALNEGLILLTCGNNGNAIRLLAPLTISDAILDEGLAKLAGALHRCC